MVIKNIKISKQFLRIQHLFLSVIFANTLVISEKSFSESIVEAEYVSLIPQKYIFNEVDQFLKKELKDIQWSLPLLAFGQNPPIELKGLHFRISPRLIQSSVSLINPNVMVIELTDNEIQMQINSLEIDHIYNQQVGGVKARLHLQARCEGLDLKIIDLQSQIKFNMQAVSKDNLLQIQSTGIFVDIKQPRIEFSSLRCEGVQGFDDYIQQTVKEYLSRPDRIHELLNQWALSFLNQKLQSLAFNWQQPRVLLNSDDLEIQLKPFYLAPSFQGNWMNKGHMEFKFKKRNFPNQFIPFSAAVPFNKSSQPVLMFPDEVLPQLMKLYLLPKQWMTSGTTQEISGFKKLMKSRWAQLFVWADLLNFSKKSVFFYRSTVSEESVVSLNSDASLNIKNQFLVSLFAPKKGEYIPYVNFKIPFQSKIDFKILNNSLQIKTEETQLKLKYQWDESYCELPGTCGSISKSTLSEALKEFLKSNLFQMPLPEWKLYKDSQPIVLNQILHDSPNKTFNLYFRTF